MTNDSPPDVLRDCLTTARDQRLQAKQLVAPDSAPDPLLGYCFSNAYVLSHILANEDIPHRIVAGARTYDLDKFDTDVRPESVGSLSQTQWPPHYWVETPSLTGVYVLELATETRPNRGHPEIHESLPADLTRFPDSYEFAEQTLDQVESSADICPECGDQPIADGYVDDKFVKTCLCGAQFTFESDPSNS